MKQRFLALVITIMLVFGLTTNAAAQSYSFEVTNEIIHVYWNDDGSVSLDYLLTFQNDAGAHVIDFVDLGLPNSSFDFYSISADFEGNDLDVSRDFQGDGPSGIAVEMGPYAINPGETGSVHIYVGKVSDMLYPDTQNENLASGQFSPAYWYTAHSTTNMVVVFHLPVGVQPDESIYHTPSSEWPGDDTPSSVIDDQGRISYTWQSLEANSYTQYFFGMSVPRTYLAADAIYTPSFWDQFAPFADTLMTFGICGCIGLFVLGSPILAIINERKRKLKYLPPKIAIEGHGIKRGLTAVEAAILMEQPLDKVMTMILFGVVKKNAATVVSKDPLRLDVVDPLPDTLHAYETKFLNAFKDPKKPPKKGLQEMTISMIKAVGDKMKGFSRKETVAYYKSIMERAWQQIEAAGTPEVKSELYEEALEWTMLDKDYDDRTRRVFTGPVFMPMWWGRYDPTYKPSVGVPKTTGGAPSIPSGRSTTSVPGSTFAASVIGGVQNFSSKVMGNVTTFTSGITKTTNPVPKSTYKGSSRSGGGGSSCACACACAGCACACAGGGR
ncbi:hypothetical protein ACFLXB_05180 [Chloroflexota bacterium]